MAQGDVKTDTKQPRSKEGYPLLTPELVAQLRAQLDAQPESKIFKN